MAVLTPDKVISILNRNSVPAPKVNAQPATQRDLSVSDEELDRLNTPEYIQELNDSVDRYTQALAERRTFITPLLTEVIPFTRENLYLMCAYTGNGKSTLSANIAYPLWQEKRKVLIISNEEKDEDVMMRIGAIHLGLNFNDFKKGRMSKEDELRIKALFPEITPYVRILGINFKSGFTTTTEGIKNALDQIKGKGYACAMIDYFQNIKNSATNPQAKTYDVLNDLRIWLGQYIKTCDVPVVMFAQLHSLSKRKGEDIDHRLKHNSDIVEPSTVIIEAIPNHEELFTSMIVWKDRFGAQGFRIKLGFDDGRFVDYDQAFQAKAAQRKQARAQNALDRQYDELRKTLSEDEE